MREVKVKSVIKLQQVFKIHSQKVTIDFPSSVRGFFPFVLTQSENCIEKKNTRRKEHFKQ